MNKIRPVLLALAVISIFTVYITHADTAGTVEDPLVTVSYLNNQYKQTVESMIANAMLGNNNPDYDITQIVSGLLEDAIIQTGAAFSPVFFAEGSTVFLGEGTEMILRSGIAKVMSPHVEMGLSNTTQGYDALDGEDIILNNVYICPRDDWRGFITDTDCWFMIKGAYSE
jgi:hypothetical protein